jgi:hypothetical protein
MAPPAGNRQAMATLVRHEAASFSPPTVRYKWIEYPLTGSQELVDLESDPTEMHNRATNPELAQAERRRTPATVGSAPKAVRRQPAAHTDQGASAGPRIRPENQARESGPRIRPESQARESGPRVRPESQARESGPRVRPESQARECRPESAGPRVRPEGPGRRTRARAGLRSNQGA